MKKKRVAIMAFSTKDHDIVEVCKKCGGQDQNTFVSNKVDKYVLNDQNNSVFTFHTFRSPEDNIWNPLCTYIFFL